MVKVPGLPTLSPTWAGPLAVQVPWLTLCRKGQDPPDALGCVLATAVHPPSTPPADTYSRFSLSSFPRGWRWPQSCRPNGRISSRATQERPWLGILSFVTSVMGFWVEERIPYTPTEPLIMASQVISISKTKAAPYFPCVLTRQYITVCTLCYGFCIPFWRQTLMNPRLASNSQYT